MRQKTLLIVAFLLVLYMAPMILASSYGHTATTLTEPNLVKDFTLSGYAVNKTMVFNGTDPYSNYTFTAGVGSQGIVSEEYVLDTDVSSDTEYFGYNEFSREIFIYASVLFTPTAVTGTYRFQPLIYMYQKTDLGSNTHWALGVMWHSGGLRLDHNTGNGNAPTLTAVDATAPIIDHEYLITLASYGNETLLEVYDNTAAGLVYSGNTTTATYDATNLYASFGQYSGGNGAMQGTWDNFTIVDSTYPVLWQEVGIATFYVSVNFDMWGMDTALIILGLVMIPASTIYLAHGAKNDRSADRLFYGLIIFMLGCGLFVGGIMP